MNICVEGFSQHLSVGNKKNIIKRVFVLKPIFKWRREIKKKKKPG